MSKLFSLSSVLVFVAITLRLMYSINTTSCLEPYTFTATDALGVLSFVFAFWGLGYLTGAEHQREQEN